MPITSPDKQRKHKNTEWLFIVVFDLGLVKKIQTPRFNSFNVNNSTFLSGVFANTSFPTDFSLSRL